MPIETIPFDASEFPGSQEAQTERIVDGLHPVTQHLLLTHSEVSRKFAE